MTTKWADIDANPDFRALSDDDKDAVRQDFFTRVVAPKIAPEQVEEVRADFEKRTNYGVRGRSTMPGPTAEDLKGAPQPGLSNAKPPEAPSAVPVSLGAARRGTMRAVAPFVAGDAQINPPPEAAPTKPMTPLSMGQLGRDVLGGVEDTKALARSAGTFAGAVDYNAAAQTLADFDQLDAGQQPTNTAPKRKNQMSGRVEFDQPNAVVQDYRLANAGDRQKMRAGIVANMQRDTQFVAESVKKVQEYAAEKKRLSGEMPNFTDVSSVSDFGNWLARTGAAGAPTMAAAMLGAAAGPLGFAVTSGGMALGDMTQARAESAAAATDPKRFTSADRAAEAAQTQATNLVQAIAKNTGTTAALAIPYAALDMLGPVGKALRGVSDEVKKSTIKAILKHGAKELPGQLIEEFANEGGQEVVNVLSDILANERPANITAEDAKRVFNSAMAGVAMAPGGHVANVAHEVYAAAREQGFHVDPPLTTDPATTRRAKVIAIFQNLGAEYGMNPEAMKRATDAAATMPAGDVGPFLSRMATALQTRRLVAKPIEQHAADTLTAGPVEDPKVEAERAKAAEAVSRETKVPDSEAGATPEAQPTEEQDALETDIQTKAGNPFPTERGASAALADNPGAKLVRVAGGWVVRAPTEAAQHETSHQTDNTQDESEAVQELKPTDLQTADNQPYGTRAGAQARATREGEGELVRVAGGWVVRPKDSTSPAEGHSATTSKEADEKSARTASGDGTTLAAPETASRPSVDSEPVAGSADGKPEDGQGANGDGHASRGQPAGQDERGQQARRKEGVAQKGGARGQDGGRQGPDENAGQDAKAPDGVLTRPTNEPEQPDLHGTAGQPAAGTSGGSAEPAGSGGAVRRVASDAGRGDKNATGTPVAGRAAAEPVHGARDGASAVAPRVIARVGTTPAAASPLELRPNSDGSHTAWHGGHEVLDFETGEPVTVPADVTDAQALQAVKDSGAFGRRSKYFDAPKKPPAEPAPAASPPSGDKPSPVAGAAEPAAARSPQADHEAAKVEVARRRAEQASQTTGRATPAPAVGEPTTPKPRRLSDAEAFANDYSAFAGRTVEQSVMVSGTDRTAVLKMDAAKAMRALDARVKALTELKACIRRAA